MNRMISNRPLVNVLGAVLLLSACSSPAEPQEVQPIESLPRQLTADERALADAGEAFAFDFLGEIARGEDPTANIFVSPLSASMALGMALAGAEAGTFEAMREALRLGGLGREAIGDRELRVAQGGLRARGRLRQRGGAGFPGPRRGARLQRPWCRGPHQRLGERGDGRPDRRDRGPSDRSSHDGLPHQCHLLRGRVDAPVRSGADRLGRLPASRWLDGVSAVHVDERRVVPVRSDA
jgi:hypothetical protein